MNLSKEDYVLKITNASAAELIVISYELTIAAIRSAAEAAEQDEKKRLIVKARAFLAEMTEALDLSHDIGKQLMRLYLFINKTLIEAGLSNDNIYQNKLLKNAEDVLNTLLPGWEEAVSQERGSVDTLTPDRTQNKSPRVYAGLTYNKNGEMEEFTEGNNRDYQA